MNVMCNAERVGTYAIDIALACFEELIKATVPSVGSQTTSSLTTG